MRPYLFACLLIGVLNLGCAFEGEIVHKISRPRPDTSLPGTEGIYSFVFRGPTGTSRPPITLPGPEFWEWQPSGKYAFYLRDRQGNERWQLVTPEVFARYEVGAYFNDREPAPPAREKYSTDNKTVQLVIRHRTKTAQVRRKAHHRRSHRALAKHRRHHQPLRIAQM